MQLHFSNPMVVQKKPWNLRVLCNNYWWSSCSSMVLASDSDFFIGFPADTSHKSLSSTVEDFIHRSSSLGQLIDLKNDWAVNKLAQQIGFLGPQLFPAGKLYSRFLFESMSDNYIQNCHPIQIENNSFFHGLNSYKELVHSISRGN